jgi:hypothetical protein
MIPPNWSQLNRNPTQKKKIKRKKVKIKTWLSDSHSCIEQSVCRPVRDRKK